MRRWNRVRLGLCLPVLALLGLVGCEYSHRGDGRYGGYGNWSYAFPSDGYYDGPYAYRYGGYRRGWWGRDWDDRKRRTDDDWKRRKRYADDDWKERRYRRLKNNDRPGDAERFNDRLCRNGIPGDAPAGC
jgi:hypothetical protein